MRFYYGDKNILRALDEAEFWKHQETEHTVVIRQIVPNLEPEYVEALQKWEEVFAQTKGAIVKYIELLTRSADHISQATEGEILQLIHCTIQQSQEFINFLHQLVTGSAAVQANPTAITVINHIRRESEYYIGIASAVIENFLQG
jgi:hypothetical protein